MKIVVAGKMCSGKTTIANMIMQYNSEYKKYSFSQKIKDIATELFNMKNKDRSLLIKIGGHMREIDNNVWVNYLMKNINTDKCIIDDLRYQNELDACLKNNFKIIKLVISKEEQINRIKKLYPKNYKDHIKNLNHISELQEFDFKGNNPVLTLDTSKMSTEKIKHELYLFLIKN